VLTSQFNYGGFHGREVSTVFSAEVEEGARRQNRSYLVTMEQDNELVN